MGRPVGDLTGRTFSYWTVVRFDRVDNGSCRRWWCVCKCTPDVERSVYQGQLLSGKSRSCGCLKAELMKGKALHVTHGASGTPEHQIWSHIRQRCAVTKSDNAENERYARYAGRGITMCERWKQSFENFLEDMGPRPSPEMTIDRKDNDLGYYKENCRWATKAKQAQNRSSTKLTEANVVDIISALRSGETRATIAGRFGVSPATVKDIRQSKSWTHLPRPWKPGDFARPAGMPKGMIRGRASRA